MCDRAVVGRRPSEAAPWALAQTARENNGDLQPGISQQCHTYGIASWMPYFGQPMQDVWDNLYLMRSGLCPELTLRFDMRKKERDYTLARRLVDHWRQFGRYFVGDYYPLTPYSQDKKVWMAWQLVWLRGGSKPAAGAVPLTHPIPL